jgi:hypothetical protein
VTALLELEPREAGTDVVEPTIEFRDGYTEEGRTRCHGCCVYGTQIEHVTNSYV